MSSSVAQNDLFVTIGKRIAHERVAIGLSQQQLADKIRVSQSLLAYYELGKRRIPISVLLDIAKTLSVSLDEILPTDRRHGPISKLDRELAKVRHFSEGQKQIVMDLIASVASNHDRTTSS